MKSFGWYENSDDIFLAMEYLPNGDLQKFLGSPMPENEGANIITQISEGLQFMHDHGFAHRDLKPAVCLIIHYMSIIDANAPSCVEHIGRRHRSRLVGHNCGFWH